MSRAPHFLSLPRGEAGFTLLELLIAMTLLGLLTVALFSGLRFGTQVWARSEAATAATDKAYAFQALLSREIERAYPLFVTKDVTETHVEFDGTPAAMGFLGPDPQGSGAMLKIELLTVRDGGAQAFEIVEHPELSIAQNETVMAELRGLRSAEFAYFGAEDEKTAPAWHASWHNMKRLPALIRIRAKFVRGTGAVWPDLVIAPRIEADVGCTIDFLTKNCQGR